MVENDFTGEKKFFNFFLYQVPNRNILKVTKYQHHMTVFKKLTVVIVRAWRNPPPPPQHE